MTSEQKGAFEVQRLFEQDGCTVYRFYDYGRARYFVTCPGATMTAYSDGKNVRHDDIPTGASR